MRTSEMTPIATGSQLRATEPWAPNYILMSPRKETLALKLFAVLLIFLGTYLKTAIGNISQDFGFMTTSFGVFITALFALISIYGSSQALSPSFWLFAVVSALAALTALYTGLRWFRVRNKPTEIIDEILKT